MAEAPGKKQIQVTNSFNRRPLWLHFRLLPEGLKGGKMGLTAKVTGWTSPNKWTLQRRCKLKVENGGLEPLCALENRYLKSFNDTSLTAPPEETPREHEDSDINFSSCLPKAGVYGSTPPKHGPFPPEFLSYPRASGPFVPC